MLKSHWRKVNIGLAWDAYDFWAVQQFEAGYLEFSEPPVLADGVLRMAGQVKGGLILGDAASLRVVVNYDPPPVPPTRGQVARVYSLTIGERVANLRHPPPPGMSWPEAEFTGLYRPNCARPHGVPVDAPPPRDSREDYLLWERARAECLRVRAGPKVSHTSPWIDAGVWIVSGNAFRVEADLREILDSRGPGVYSVKMWVADPMGGHSPYISRYFIFHGVEPPDTYGGG